MNFEIHHLNRDGDNVSINDIYNPLNIIKYKRGNVFYFFKEIKIDNCYEKGSNIVEVHPTIHFVRANHYSGDYTHVFKNGETFTDRFEFVDFDAIPNGSDKKIIVDVIKKYNTSAEDVDVLFMDALDGTKDMYTTTKLGSGFSNLHMDNYLEIIKKTKEKYDKGSIDHVAIAKEKAEPLIYARFYGESNEEWDKRLKETIDSVSKETFGDNQSELYKELQKLAIQHGKPIITAEQTEQVKPETIILKKRTHKKDNKVVVSDKKYICSVDPALGDDVTAYISTGEYIHQQMASSMGIPRGSMDIPNNLGKTNSQHNSGLAMDFKTTGELGVVMSPPMPSKTIFSRYANKVVNPKYYAKIKIGHDDSIKVLSKKDKKTDNKVCMLEDKLLIL